MVNIDDFNFANNLYTKISDIKVNNDLDGLTNYESKKIKNDDIGRSKKLKEDIEIKKGNTNLDYLYYEEDYIKPTKKVIIKKEKSYKTYFIIFIAFMFLNSSYVINFINSYKVKYITSLFIRSAIFMIIYHLLKKID